MKPRNIALIVFAAVVIIGGAIAISKTDSMGHMNMSKSNKKTAAVPTDPNAVFIDNYTYSPTPLKVKKGTKVTWTNHDIAKHTVTVDSGTGPMSAFFGKGETYSYTFDTVGTYKYHCEPHPYMHGTVEVTE